MFSESGLKRDSGDGNLPVSLAISGSFRRHLGAIREVMAELRGYGAVIASPRGNLDYTGETDGFVHLHGDTGRPRDVQLRHMQAIRGSDALYVVCPDGYVGLSTALEAGAALASGVPVYTTHQPCDFIFAELSSVVSPSELLSAVAHRTELPSGSSLGDLQSHFAKVAHERGFADETPTDLMLLFTEELGELARAIRVSEGLARHQGPEDATEGVGEELADCMIYVLSLANVLGVNLDTALKDKESVNKARSWSRQQPSAGSSS